jgi:hypothetical protein
MDIGDGVSPGLLRAWAKSQVPPPRPIPELEMDSEVEDVRTDADAGLMVLYRKEGKNEAGDPWPFEWVPVDAASSPAISEWARTEKKRVEGTMRYRLTPCNRTAGVTGQHPSLNHPHS